MCRATLFRDHRRFGPYRDRFPSDSAILIKVSLTICVYSLPADEVERLVVVEPIPGPCASTL